ncbi:hypothetical protein D3C75_1276510 [compost metagenome]
MIAERTADNHCVTGADILRCPIQARRDHPNTGGVDKHFVGRAALHHLGIPGHNADTGLLRSGRHRSHQPL